MPRSVGLYLLLVFVGGALVAPWLYEIVHGMAAHFAPLEFVARQPFPRYVNRSFLIVGLLGLWPFLRANRMFSLEDLGLRPTHGALRQLGKGWLLGFASLALVAILALTIGPAKLDLHRGAFDLVRRILRAAFSAVAVGGVEEIVFRSAMFGCLRKRFYWPVALAASSVLYATVHLLQRAPPPETVHWDSGLIVFGGMLPAFLDLQQVVPGLLSLTVAGVILGLSYQITGRIYLAIGLHAAWIFWLQTSATLTTRTPESSLWFWGTEKLIDGWFTFLILLLLGGTARFWIGTRAAPTLHDRQA